MRFKPGYRQLFESGELDERVDALYRILARCELCPRRCGANRLEGEKGYCQMGKELVVSSYGPHFGEERVLVGRGGSGTIFLTGCNLLCVYCQNYEISHLLVGDVMGEEPVAGIMLHLQRRGCHNINFVTPTHFAPHLVKALRVAAERGLRLPIVWNCSGYENAAVIALLEGIVDIYMPDVKYGTGTSAKRYSNAPDYFARCTESVREMHRQVGDLQVDATGVAYRGLLVRHLVLPDDLAGSDAVLTFLRDLSRGTYVNIMDQYRPKGGAWEFRELSRSVTREEYARALASATRLGLTRLDSVTT
jgi:putative pyruvate formate lyase activating enzyme